MKQEGITKRPNVIFVLTDDQGYPDLGCCGNPWIHTPNIDQFSHESVRMNDFHVAPLCAPTRGALMSGHRPTRNGVWATCWGRSLLDASEKILPQYFSESGYVTGIFGKWHLGDNYPFRPEDRGFQRVIAHKGGGVGQTPDFWGNNYFDDTYFVDGKPQNFEGYCTDVWFDEGIKFIEQNKDTPFFCYIATNAPHYPYLVDKKYAKPYEQNQEIVEPDFYGMISNIDENFGKLRSKLQELGIEDQTILIFMTDNGSSGSAEFDRNGYAVRGYNASMRGRKGSYYDGGHRVPFFIRWPDGGLENLDVNEMALHVDFLPTMLDLCSIPLDAGKKPDGISLKKLLTGEETELPFERCDFVQLRQSTEPPRKWDSAVITRDWRLVYGRELYRIKEDPEQRNDISDKYPEVVKHLRNEFEKYWEEVAPSIDDYQHIILGNPHENPACLTSMDVMGDVAWNQEQVARALKITGKWNVQFDSAGTYRFELRRWPQELELPLADTIEDSEVRKLTPYNRQLMIESFLKDKEIKGASLQVFNQKYQKAVNPDDIGVVFEIEITSTEQTILEAEFLDDQNQILSGAYYVYVEKI